MSDFKLVSDWLNDRISYPSAKELRVSTIIIKQFASNKSILLLKIILKRTYITTKLKQKFFSEVIKMPSEEAWVWIDRESN